MAIPTPSAGRLHDVRVVENSVIGEELRKLVIEDAELARAIKPGQFVNIAVSGEPRQLTRIPLSFAECDDELGLIVLVYAIIGPGTARLAEIGPGETLSVLGPLGNGWRLADDAKRALLVSGGTGTVPVFAAALALASSGVAVDFVVGARTRDLLWGLDELRAHISGDLIATTDDGSFGEAGFASEPALELLSERSYDAVFTCGPEPLMKAISNKAAELGVSCQVSMERTMACGFGACSTCAVRTTSGMKGACMDGPVFDGREVVWS